MTNERTPTKQVSVMYSMVPILILLALLTYNVVIFGDNSASGPNQIALLFSGIIAALIGLFVVKIPYKTLEEEIVHSISLTLQAMIILLVVGSLISIWIISGIVPSFIYYGLLLVNPSYFLPLACIVCIITSLASGSSWSTAGTIGVALMVIGQAMGIPAGMVAGAIISGAYFGDKLSPMSDTTNLAPAMAGTDLFTHIKHMFYTTFPAILIALVLFTGLGLMNSTGKANSEELSKVISVLDATFYISPIIFIFPALVFVAIWFKVPALPSLILGIVLGVIATLIFQVDILTEIAGEQLSFKVIYSTLITAAFDGIKLKTENALLNDLLSRGGMSNMLNTVWLIICAMFFGGAMEASGMLQAVVKSLLKYTNTAGKLIGATLGSCIFFNITASEQYIAIVVPGRMFRSAYDKFNLDPRNLSRALEDAGTVTSVLVPWNSCGAYISGVLGVSTLTYMPYCFFNLLMPVISLLFASMGWTIIKKHQHQSA